MYTEGIPPEEGQVAFANLHRCVTPVSLRSGSKMQQNILSLAVPTVYLDLFG